MTGRHANIVSFIILFTSLSACGPTVSHYVRVDQALSQRHFDEADRVVEESHRNYGSRSDLLYLMDRGMTLHLAGHYAESNRYFAAAEDKIESLYAVSISQEASSFLLNDYTLSYEGEDFEKVMINVVAALNYALLGQWDDALVEARKVDHKLTLLNDRYEKKNVYKEDALARYLSGILYEAKGEINDAFISYRNAYEAFQDYNKNYQTPIPSFIGPDLLRTSEALGLIEEEEDYRRTFPGTDWEKEKSLSQKGEAIFLAYVGLSPVKIDRFVDIPIPDGQGGIYPVRLAFPRFVQQPVRSREVEVRIDDRSIRGEMVEDVGAIAVKNLDDRIGRIAAKEIARATAKAAASLKIRQEAAKSGDPGKQFLANLSTDLFSLLSEKADKRSWRTLPDEIFLSRVPLTPGSHNLQVRYLDAEGRVLQEHTFPLSLKAGEKRFVIDRVMN